MNTLMAKLCGAQANDKRTIAETKGIPTKEDIAYSFRTAKAMATFLKTQKITMAKKGLDIETNMVEQEVRCILDKVLEMGDGNVVIGTIRAVKVGVLDNPFATNPVSPCKVMGIKDSEGAIRYFNPGNLPFTSDILEFHRSKIMERENKKGIKLNYDTLVSDLLAVNMGVLVE